MRGVRIIPEFDVPAHAAGLWPLAGTRGLQFCDDERTTLRDDAVTIGLVQQVFDAVVALFPDAVVHVGGDETCPHGVCPDACDYSAVNNVERAVQTHLVDTHGRTPMGWNEVWSEPEGGEPNGALPELTSHLEVGQFYTAHDISGIVEYGALPSERAALRRRALRR